MRCDVCGVELARFACGGCNQQFYCTRAHAHQSWHAEGHKSRCTGALATGMPKRKVEAVVAEETNVAGEDGATTTIADDGNVQPPKRAKAAGRSLDKARAQADKLIRGVSVAMTGARVGDYLVGVSAANKGAVIEVIGAEIPPAPGALLVVHEAGQQNEARAALRTVPFLREKDQQIAGGVLVWLQEQADTAAIPTSKTNLTLPMDINPGTRFRFHSLGGGSKNALVNPDDLSPEDALALLDRVPRRLSDLETGMMRRTVLMYSTHDWKLMRRPHEHAGTSPEAQQLARTGLVVDVTTGQSWRGEGADESIIVEIQLLPGTNHAYIRYPRVRGAPALHRDRARELYLGALSETDDPALDWDVHHAPAFDSVGLLGMGALKSGLQKLIRFRPRTVRIGSVTVPAARVLAAFVVHLALHRGALIPDLQIYTTGLQALPKRLLVTLFEDSFLPRERSSDASLLAAAMLLTKYLPEWSPAEDLLRHWVRIAIGAMEEARYFPYFTTAAQDPFALKNGIAPPLGGPLGYASAALDNARSFPGDLALLRYVAYARATEAGWANLDTDLARAAADGLPRPDIMPYAHIVDHHWLSGIAYLLPPTLVSASVAPDTVRGKPYQAILNRLFREVTGINPRYAAKEVLPERERYGDAFEERAFVRDVRLAQERALRMRLGGGTKIAVPGRDRGVAYQLDDEWLSGMLGDLSVPTTTAAERRKLPVEHPAHTIRASGTLSVLRRTDNSGGFSAIRRPATRAKEHDRGPLGEDEQDAAIQLVLRKLYREPIVLAGEPVGELHKARAQLTCEPPDERTGAIDPNAATFVISGPALSRGADLPGSKSYAWEDLQRGEVRVGVFELDPGGGGDDVQYENAYEGGAAVADDVDAHLARVLQLPCAQDPRVMRLVLRIMQQQVGGRVRLPKLARDGGAQPGGSGVSIHLTAAHAILQRLAEVYPGALGRVSGQIGVYAVAVQPLLWELQEKLSRLIQLHERGVGGDGAGSAADAPLCGRLDGWAHQAAAAITIRAPRPSQQRVLSAMQTRVRHGTTSHFVYMTVGTGKTHLTALYMRFLQSTGALPEYVIVTTPSAVVDTVAAEYALAGFQVHHYAASESIMRAKAARAYVTAPLPFTVTVVEHDQLRLLVDPLAEIAGRALIVVDEVHLMFNTNTQRTSTAQALAGAAAGMVLMTGTPIVNGNPATMSPWLSRVVKFEITPRNFWVAAGAMYKAIEQTDNVTEARLITLPESTLPAAYRERVPPAMGGAKVGATPKDFGEAMDMCYEICDLELVRQVSEYLRLPPIGGGGGGGGGGVQSAVAVLGGGIPRGAVVVARTTAHQARLHQLLVEAVDGFIDPSGVHRLDRGGINLTPARVRDGLVPAYRVVVMTTRQAHGINLTYLNSMFSSVYPSNQATREQLLGRINRIGQPVGKGAGMGSLLYVTVSVGLLNYILENHDKAKTLSAALQMMAMQ